MANFNPQRNIGADFVNQIFGTVIQGFQQEQKAVADRDATEYSTMMKAYADDPTSKAVLGLIGGFLDKKKPTKDTQFVHDLLRAQHTEQTSRSAKYTTVRNEVVNSGFSSKFDKMLSDGKVDEARGILINRIENLSQLSDFYPERIKSDPKLTAELNNLEVALKDFQVYDIDKNFTEQETRSVGQTIDTGQSLSNAVVVNQKVESDKKTLAEKSRQSKENNIVKAHNDLAKIRNTHTGGTGNSEGVTEEILFADAGTWSRAQENRLNELKGDLESVGGDNSLLMIVAPVTQGEQPPVVGETDGDATYREFLQGKAK